MSVQDCFISAKDVGGLVGVSDWERVFERSGGDLMFLYESPVNTIDLGSRVNDCGGVDVFHSEREDDEFHFNVQGVLSSGSTMNGSREFLRRSSFPFQKSWLYFSCGLESRPMTRSSSSSAIFSTEAAVSTTATFLVGGRAEEQAGRGGRFV